MAKPPCSAVLRRQRPRSGIASARRGDRRCGNFADSDPTGHGGQFATCKTTPEPSTVGSGAVVLPQFLRLSLRLFQPEPHVHLVVHRRCGGEVLPGLIALVCASVKPAEPEMAVGDERAHPE